MTPCKILLNIDCIFDVMLGCVTYVNENWVMDLIKNGYISRVHNTLSKINPAIDDDLIRECWETRDIHILKLSPRTNIINLLTSYVAQSNSCDPDHPQSLNYKIVLNTYPYNFSDIELRELFSCLKLIIGIKNLTRVHMPVSAITPEYLKSNFDRIVLYDLHEWLGYHKSQLAITRIPHVNFVVPLCYCIGMEDSGEEEEAVKNITAGLSPFIDLEFVRLADVSIHIPKGYYKQGEKNENDGNDTTDVDIQ